MERKARKEGEGGKLELFFCETVRVVQLSAELRLTAALSTRRRRLLRWELETNLQVICNRFVHKMYDNSNGT